MINNGLNEVIKLNKEFYSEHNESFDKSRSFGFWNGFDEVLNYLPKNLNILDLGCGNGRFLKFLLENKIKIDTYLGVDNNEDFIHKNSINFPNYDFENLDIITKLEEIPNKYSLITVFGVTHHIPSKEFRRSWFVKLASKLEKEGVLVLSFWNFDSEKSDKNFRTKEYLPEPGDYFLGWKENYSAHRFCHYFNEYEIEEIIKSFINFKLVKKFNLDQNTYLILKKE